MNRNGHVSLNDSEINLEKYVFARSKFSVSWREHTKQKNRTENLFGFVTQFSNHLVNHRVIAWSCHFLFLFSLPSTKQYGCFFFSSTFAVWSNKFTREIILFIFKYFPISFRHRWIFKVFPMRCFGWMRATSDTKRENEERERIRKKPKGVHEHMQAICVMEELKCGSIHILYANLCRHVSKVIN